MKTIVRTAALITGLVLTAARAVATPDVDAMSDIEVSEYAVRMSSVLEKIEHNHLCVSQDVQCVRAELARNGISYEDKEPVQKRLVILIGSMY